MRSLPPESSKACAPQSAMRLATSFINVALVVSTMSLLGVPTGLATSPIRVSTDFQLPPELSPTATDHVHHITRSALTELKRFVQVVNPVSGNLTVPRSVRRYFKCRPPPDQPCFDKGCPIELSRVCNRAIEKSELHEPSLVCFWACNGGCDYVGGSSMPVDVDLLLYVTADGTSPECTDQLSKTTIAHGEACQFDPSTGRPLSGGINFCPHVTLPQRNNSLAIGRQIDSVLHQLVHVLGFDHESLRSLNLVSGVTRREYGIVQQMNGTEVAQLAQKHFNCSNATGLDLENNYLPDLSDYSQSTSSRSEVHWEFRLTEDLMVASTDGAQLPRSPITSFTLAALNDTGWYVTNASAGVQPISGKNAGCEHFESSCDDPSTSKGEFCEERNYNRQCTRDESAIAQCSDHPLADGCRVPEFTLRQSCKHTRTAQQQTLFGQWRSAQSSICMRSLNDTSRLINDAVYTLPEPGFGCFETECSDSGSELYVTLPSCNDFNSSEPGCDQRSGSFPGPAVKLTCKSEGHMINLGNSRASDELGYTSGSIVCPDPGAVCRSTSCPNRCSNHGICDGDPGECMCFAGFAGSDCSMRRCTDGECSGKTTCNFQSGQCE